MLVLLLLQVTTLDKAIVVVTMAWWLGVYMTADFGEEE
jgi:hypothetical protein